MKTNLEKLIELYTEYVPEIECGTNKIGEYGNNFRMSMAFNKLIENDYQLLNELVDFDIYSKSGVYMINDFYIGASKYGKSEKSDGVYNGIRNRVAGHLHEMFYYYWNTHFNELYNGEWDDVRYNYLKTNKMWQSFIENDRLTVTQLSDNPLDEVDLINEYFDKVYDLQNPQQLIERYENQLSSNTKLKYKINSTYYISDLKYVINSLKEHRNWNIGNIYFNNYDYVRLFRTFKNDKLSLYHKYINGDIDRQEFLHKCDLNKIEYRIYTDEFIEFDKNFRLSYEEISTEQINKYK